jgi:hypothetical protein
LSRESVKKIAQEVISDSVAKDVLEEYSDREALLMQEISRIDSKLESVPSRKLVGMTAQLIKRHIESIHRNGRKFEQMTFQEKRALAQFVFAGRDPEGNRCGVYVEKTDSDKYSWGFSIRGLLATRENERLPMKAAEARAVLGIEDASVDPLQRTYQQEMLCSDEG